MCVLGTEKTLTVDADVFGYYYQFTQCNKSLPRGLSVTRMADFCKEVIENYPIAINDFIKTEYGDLVGHEFVKNWMIRRLKNNLAKEVSFKQFDNRIKRILIQEYGFDFYSNDCKYLKTAFNTISKRLITGNRVHFQRQHKRNKRQSMHYFLFSDLAILINSIDQCCCALLDAA